MAAAPADLNARMQLAEGLAAAGQHAAAADELLAIIRADAGWRDGAAKATLLRLLGTLGPGNATAAAARKALSKLLFR